MIENVLKFIIRGIVYLIILIMFILVSPIIIMMVVCTLVAAILLSLLGWAFSKNVSYKENFNKNLYEFTVNLDD